MKKPQYSELGLRPTTSKVIGAIFSMMGHSNLEGKNFLDLYAGTGSVGIRALELGAKHCFLHIEMHFRTFRKSHNFDLLF